jgi:small subunit ribosomal protein S6
VGHIPWKGVFSKAMKREYELGCLLRLESSDEVVNENIQQITNWIEAEDQGKVTKIDRWGRRRLAYEIDRQREGYYVFIHADVDPASIPELERELNLAQFLLRYLVIRLEE